MRSSTGRCPVSLWVTMVQGRPGFWCSTVRPQFAWFVREVLGAPDWRWISINQANCGLTVLHQKPGRPWTMVTHNDTGHLPVELRTGLPDPLLF